MDRILKKHLLKFVPSAIVGALVNFEYPDPMRVLGLSTSHYTNVVDWKVAYDAGIRFAYIKAQNGVNNPVLFWKENYEGAMKAGILVGGYTWLYPATTVSPGTQAHKLIEFSKVYPAQLPWCVDFEWTSPKNPNSGDLWGFVKPFEDGFGKKPAIYTAIGYWDQYGSNDSMWASYPLWQAQYNGGQADDIRPWNNYTFLQWTQTGKGIDYGVPTNGEIACELNYYQGTIEELYQYYGEVVVPPATIPPVEIPQGVVMKGTAKAVTNVKPVKSDGTTKPSMQIKDYAFGTKGLTDLMGFDHFYRADGTLVPLEVPCKAYLGNLVLSNETEETTIPPVDPPIDPPVSEPVTVSVVVAGVPKFQAEYPAGTDVQISVPHVQINVK